jgi:hypothetical protein
VAIEEDELSLVSGRRRISSRCQVYCDCQKDIVISRICLGGAHIELQTTEYRLAAKVEEVSVDNTTALMPASSREELRLEAFAQAISNWVGS